MKGTMGQENTVDSVPQPGRDTGVTAGAEGRGMKGARGQKDKVDSVSQPAPAAAAADAVVGDGDGDGDDARPRRGTGLEWAFKW